MKGDQSSNAQFEDQFSNFFGFNDHSKKEKIEPLFDDDFYTYDYMASPLQSPIISPVRSYFVSPINSPIRKENVPKENTIDENKGENCLIGHKDSQNANKSPEAPAHTNVFHFPQNSSYFSNIHVTKSQVNACESHVFHSIPRNFNRRENKTHLNGRGQPTIRHRQNFPDAARTAMNTWLLNNYMNPYPSIYVIQSFSRMFGLTEKQIKVFFTNQRVRFLNRKGIRKSNPLYFSHRF